MPRDKICPECGRRFRWYDNDCPDCNVVLVDVTDDDEPTPDAEIVSVFSTSDMGLLPLAQMELDRAGILYETKHSSSTKISGEHREPVEDGAELVVRGRDAERARDLLVDLEHATPLDVAEPAEPQGAAAFSPVAASADAPVALFDMETGRPIGRLTIAQFDSLDAKLEHSADDDDDFYVDEATLVMLEEQGVDGEVVQLLRRALAGRSGMDVRWVEE